MKLHEVQTISFHSLKGLVHRIFDYRSAKKNEYIFSKFFFFFVNLFIHSRRWRKGCSLYHNRWRKHKFFLFGDKNETRSRSLMVTLSFYLLLVPTSWTFRRVLLILFGSKFPLTVQRDLETSHTNVIFQTNLIGKSAFVSQVFCKENLQPHSNSICTTNSSKDKHEKLGQDKKTPSINKNKQRTQRM